MPGTITIDSGKTFATMLVLSVAQKTKFGTTEPDISATGQKKWAVDCAVTYFADPGMRPVSEVIAITVTGPANLDGITPGMAVQFADLRMGVSAPERGSNDRIRGGKAYFMASSVRQAQARQPEHKAA